MPSHACHCPHCKTKVHPRMFGCKSCWFFLPQNMRDTIWATYKPGQEITKTPSAEYIQAARAAVEYLREHHDHA